MSLWDMVRHVHRRHVIAAIKMGGAGRGAATAAAQAAVDDDRAKAHVLTPRATPGPRVL